MLHIPFTTEDLSLESGFLLCSLRLFCMSTSGWATLSPRGTTVQETEAHPDAKCIPLKRLPVTGVLQTLAEHVENYIRLTQKTEKGAAFPPRPKGQGFHAEYYDETRLDVCFLCYMESVRRNLDKLKVSKSNDGVGKSERQTSR